MYDAHIRENGESQTVAEHLTGTSQRSGQFAAAFGQERRGALLGMAHDIGKNSEAFQRRLHGGPKVDHATAGALECCNVKEQVAGCCVAGHHSGLPDFGNPTDLPGDATYIGRIKKGKQGIPAYEWSGTLDTNIPMPNLKDGFSQSFWLRMLYSCLVDADYLDTEAFLSPVARPEYDTLPELLHRLQTYIEPWYPAITQLNRNRCRILNQCLDAASSPRGIYTLTVPTGGGKTVSSLAFALKHAVENGLARIIYVIPYTSIIEQNADIFRHILGERNVVEHHCNAQFDRDEELAQGTVNQRLATENWDAPIIVTTAVQFFESLYSNLPSKCRKLHNIANSVLVFDEAQMIPGSQLKPCVGAIAQLVAHFRATAVLCTATQPVLGDLIQDFCPNLQITEICPQAEQLVDSFRRVTYRNGGHLNHSELAEKLTGEQQVLCIVNTRKAAQEIFDRLPEHGRFHLSTLMYPKHRTKVLQQIRERLKNGLPCRVVSTSLIEAGVDVDFPAVYRQLAGLDSLIQAAGRCNREGKRPAEDSPVIYFEGEEPAPQLQQVNIGAAREVLRNASSVDELDTIRRYFTVWRSLIGDHLDKNHVVDHLTNGDHGCWLPFRRVAQDFQMIDQTTKTVYIPMGDGAESCQRIAEGVADRDDYRQAGQYSVNLYEPHFRELVASGDVCPVDDNSGLLSHPELYDQEKGLSLKAEFGKAIFL